MAKLALILLTYLMTIIKGLSSFEDGVQFNQICPNIMHQVFEKYSPAGDNKAGNFTEHSKNVDLKVCVEECCILKSNCNVAFIFNNKCYHVKCVSNELCLPKLNTQIDINTKLQMVLVNPVSDGTAESPSWIEILKNANIDDFIPLNTKNAGPTLQWKTNPHNFRYPETIQNPIQYADDEQTADKRFGDFLLGRKLDFERYGTEQQYSNDDTEIQDEEPSYMANTNLITCEFGLDNLCRPNEECIQIIPKSREGVCNCIDGFKRNKIGDCIKLDLDFSPSTIVENILANTGNTLSSEINDSNRISDSSKSNPLKHLTVSVLSKNVQLPDKEVTLSAYTVPDEKSSGEIYKFLWTLISQPKGAVNGTISDQAKDKIKLSNLSEGNYTFKVSVTGNSSYGETFANVTVLPEKRINKIPQVIITPKNQTVKLSNSQAILDGSTSIDDDKIVTWHWELIQGPIGYEPKLPDTSTLQLTDLNSPGNYTFKLTVTDSDNAQNSTTANIQVLKSIDYPPEANAGNDVIIYLPHNNVTLNGSLSTDDKEIVAWEWTKGTNDQGKAVDMQNTRTPYLQLSNLEEGIYTFVLKVTDASNQSNTATVHVFVKPATNSPPIANAGHNTTINLPQTWIILNGTESKDDISVTNYFWRQMSGPNSAVIENSNASIANATSLTIGIYHFQLVVADVNKNNASDDVWIKVIQEKNSPPIANAGGDQSVTLPVNAIYLNGSKSTDDLGIVNYTWTRDSSSLAAGNIVGSTYHEPVLVLMNVVPGRYVFRLTVTDDQGLTGSDTVSIIVHPDPNVLNLAELTLSMGISILTQSELESLEQKIVLLIGDVKLHVRELKLEPKSSNAILVFYVEKLGADGRNQILPGLEVEKILKDKFWRDASILGTTFIDVRTTICQNKCSDHGLCNTITRACMCETFWMPSVFYFWGIDEANCDWSILYVVVGIFTGFIVLSAICWGITCICRKSRKPRSRPKLQKYAPLGTHDEELPSFARGTSLTDSETDSDVLFESRSKQNGILRSNGVSKTTPKYSTTRLGRRIKT